MRKSISAMLPPSCLTSVAAAMAGALGLRLAGPRIYGSARVEDAWMGDGRAEATPDDLSRALALYRTACALQIVAVVMLVIVPG